jgi:hypothetical protein
MVQYFSLTPRMFFFLNDDCTFVLFVLCPWALQLEGAKMQGTQPKHFSLATCVSVLHFICQAYGCEIFLGRMPKWSGSRKERIDPIPETSIATERVRTYFKHVQDLEVISVKRPPRPGGSGDWKSGGRPETRPREIAGDGAESCNPQIRRPPTPRRHPRSGCHLRIRHR